MGFTVNEPRFSARFSRRAGEKGKKNPIVQCSFALIWITSGSCCGGRSGADVAIRPRTHALGNSASRYRSTWSEPTGLGTIVPSHAGGHGAQRFISRGEPPLTIGAGGAHRFAGGMSVAIFSMPTRSSRATTGIGLIAVELRPARLVHSDLRLFCPGGSSIA